jgi:hypothetical protein
VCYEVWGSLSEIEQMTRTKNEQLSVPYDYSYASVQTGVLALHYAVSTIGGVLPRVSFSWSRSIRPVCSLLQRHHLWRHT